MNIYQHKIHNNSNHPKMNSQTNSFVIYKKNRQMFHRIYRPFRRPPRQLNPVQTRGPAISAEEEAEFLALLIEINAFVQ